MGRPRHLEHAPIREAIVDLQFPILPTVDQVAEFADGFARTKRAETKDIWTTLVALKHEAASAPETAHSSDMLGKRVDAEGKVFQFRRNGFTVSQLPPYPRWEDLRDAALPVWRDFSRHLGLEDISRIAVRYINVIDVPLPLADFADYLAMPPIVPPELPQGVAQFLNRIVVPMGHDVASITQALEGPPVARDELAYLQVVIDIDVFREGRWRTADVDTVVGILEGQRDAKNTAFFALLTEKTLGAYE